MKIIRLCSFSILYVALFYLQANRFQEDIPPQQTVSIDTLLQEKKILWMNVFVHGVMSLGPLTPVYNFFMFMNDEIEGTVYESTIHHIRSNPFFYQSQAISELGLQQIDITTPEKGNGANCIAALFATMQNYAGESELQNYYTFGWSGVFSKKGRAREAEKLFEALVNERKQLIQQGYEPHIRLLGYCHGGQVCLELAKYADLNQLLIPELLLIATPVSPDMEEKINSPIFQRVCHLFSAGDRVQPIDIFTTETPRQVKTVSLKNPTALQNKFIQIELRVTRYQGTLPETIDWNDPIHSIGARSHWRDCSPGHIELWFCGWTPGNYRSIFSLYPLPAGITLLPHILKYIDTEEMYFDYEKPIIVDLRPDYLSLIFRQYTDAGLDFTVHPWITETQWDTILGIMEQARPETPITQAEYDRHIANAKMRAQALIVS